MSSSPVACKPPSALARCPPTTLAAMDDPSPPPAAAELVPLDPRVRWAWWASAAIAVVPAVAVAALTVVVAPVPDAVRAVVAAVAVAAVLAAAVVPAVRYQRWRYALRHRDLWIRKGVLWVTVSVIPYQRLQFVDTRQGPLDRVFGLAQLVVHTAALGTSGRLPGLDAAEAERLRERLAAVEPDVATV